jgi:hypothetical protein
MGSYTRVRLALIANQHPREIVSAANPHLDANEGTALDEKP